MFLLVHTYILRVGQAEILHDIHELIQGFGQTGIVLLLLSDGARCLACTYEMVATETVLVL